MAKVLVVAEHRDGKLKKSSFEIIAALSSQGHEVHTALLGQGVAGLATELGTYGAKTVHVGENPALALYSSEAYTHALIGIVKQVGPEIVFASHTPTGRDFMPYLAAKLDAGLITDCISLTISGSSVSVRRPVYAGKASVEATFSGSGVKLITMRANSLGQPKADASKKAEVVNVAVQIPALKSKVVQVEKVASGRPDVTEASVVVSGGRSMKTAENFGILEKMADILGGAVGASRAAVDAGLRPHRDQVGQTGKVVSPSLYIACGVSGAIQHLAGMRTSKVIVAINTDPEAPMFQVADYGIVADLFTMVPLLTEEFKKIKEHH